MVWCFISQGIRLHRVLSQAQDKFIFTLIFSTFNDPNDYYTESNDGVVCEWWILMMVKKAWPILKHYPSTSLERLRKTLVRTAELRGHVSNPGLTDDHSTATFGFQCF